MPGSAKTASITTVPPITQLVWTLSTDTVLISELRMIWRRSTSLSLNPLPRRIDEFGRAHRNQAAAQTADGQRRGAERDHQRRQEEMPKPIDEAFAIAGTGNSGTLIPSSRISSTPSQKAGIDITATKNAWMAKSVSDPRLPPTMSPAAG